MKKILFFALLTAICGIFGCSMPYTSVRTVDERPTLAFKNAPNGAILFIDGVNMGDPVQFNGDPNVLAVEPGSHSIRITSSDTVVYEQKIFVESALKTITVR
jgi:hypothetical protein